MGGDCRGSIVGPCFHQFTVCFWILTGMVPMKLGPPQTLCFVLILSHRQWELKPRCPLSGGPLTQGGERKQKTVDSSPQLGFGEESLRQSKLEGQWRDGMVFGSCKNLESTLELWGKRGLQPLLLGLNSALIVSSRLTLSSCERTLDQGDFANACRAD